MKSRISKRVEDAAADWLVRQHSGLIGHEQNELAVWLSSAPQHRETYARLERAWQELNHPRQTGQAAIALSELTRRRQRRLRRAVFATATGLCAAMILLFVFLPVKAPQALPPASPTAVVRPDARHLPDGSVVELNAGAQFAWDFSAAQRDVQLIRGEALFSVAKDAMHPFVVAAGNVRVRAVGTAFSVCLRPDAVDVLVTEGKVKVDLASTHGAGESITLIAGERTTIAVDSAGIPVHVDRVTLAEVQQALAWQSKRIEFTRAPLSEVADIFNRENVLKLEIGDESIRGLQITGIYWADDPEGLIRLLNVGLDLKTDRRDGAVVLRRP